MLDITRSYDPNAKAGSGTGLRSFLVLVSYSMGARLQDWYLVGNRPSLRNFNTSAHGPNATCGLSALTP
jgi:hypothetical protein